MMDTTILTALISASATLCVCLVNNHYQQVMADKKHSETIALIEYKLGELARQVERHNQVVERTYKLEESQSVMQEQIKVANHRIEDLERGQA